MSSTSTSSKTNEIVRRDSTNSTQKDKYYVSVWINIPNSSHDAYISELREQRQKQKFNHQENEGERFVDYTNEFFTKLYSSLRQAEQTRNDMRLIKRGKEEFCRLALKKVSDVYETEKNVWGFDMQVTSYSEKIITLYSPYFNTKEDAERFKNYYTHEMEKNAHYPQIFIEDYEPEIKCDNSYLSDSIEMNQDEEYELTEEIENTCKFFVSLYVHNNQVYTQYFDCYMDARLYCETLNQCEIIKENDKFKNPTLWAYDPSEKESYFFDETMKILYPKHMFEGKDYVFV